MKNILILILGSILNNSTNKSLLEILPEESIQDYQNIQISDQLKHLEFHAPYLDKKNKFLIGKKFYERFEKSPTGTSRPNYWYKLPKFCRQPNKHGKFIH